MNAGLLALLVEDAEPVAGPVTGDFYILAPGLVRKVHRFRSTTVGTVGAATSVAAATRTTVTRSATVDGTTGTTASVSAATYTAAGGGGLSITSVNSALTSITGSGFGTGGATNITWDNFESGVVDETATVGTWGDINDLVVSHESRHANSTHCAYHNFLTEATAGPRCVSSVLSQKWFCQYWVKLVSFGWNDLSSGRLLQNVKFFRLWNPGDTVYEDFFCQFGWGLTEKCNSNNEGIGGQFKYFNDTSFSKSTLSDGAWHCLQFEFMDSSAPDVADSTFKLWHNGQVVESRTGMINRTDSLLKRPFFLGFYNAFGPGGGEPTNDPNHYYIDDIYAVPTLARVEIGNASVYGSCSHREIQIPTAWSNTSITCIFNKGTFVTGQTAYLFVVDPTGLASAGKAVVIP